MVQDRGILSDPLKGWGNDDLLFNEQARTLAKDDDAGVFELLDWPEFRVEFQKHENSAKCWKKKSRTLGFSAVCMLGIGSAALPVVSLTGAPVLLPLTFVCAVLIVCGFSFGFIHLCSNRGTPPWLSHRLFAERLRHLYFQVILSEFDLLFSVLSGVQPKTHWYEARSKKLNAAIDSFDQQFRSGWREMRDDIDFRDFEVLGCDLNSDKLSRAFQLADEQDSETFERLINRLNRQRIDIQYNFTARNLTQTVATPPLRNELLSVFSALSVVGVPLVALVMGVFLFIGDGGVVHILTACLGTLASMGLIARVVEEGLKFKADEERYSAYLSAVRVIKESYSSGGSKEKALAFRRLEQEAYRETRQFFVTHLDDKFLG